MALPSDSELEYKLSDHEVNFNEMEDPKEEEKSNENEDLATPTTQNTQATDSDIVKTKRVEATNSDIDLRIQAQEHMYRLTLTREKSKVSVHALEEVGRSINAISQRRRQYFLDYKDCNSIRSVRQWFAWETKRNLDTNQNSEVKSENAATRGLKVFLNKIEFYGTLLARFGEYMISLLLEHYSVDHEENFEVSKTKTKMLELQEECEILLSDNHEVVLTDLNHTEVENRFPIISILPTVHNTLCQMTDLATLWRLHARFAQQFEDVIHRRSKLESVQQLDDKREILKNIQGQIRHHLFDIAEIGRQLREREEAMNSNEFRDVYTKCTDRLDQLSDMVEERKLDLKTLDTTIKYLHEKTETFKKMKTHKRKLKLEMNVKKKEEKLLELQQIRSEIAKLDEQKKKLDMKEEMWLRGGFQEELAVQEDLKNKLTSLRETVVNLEQERDEMKSSYHVTREKVMELDAEHERLTHEYEYVKRLSVTMLPALWNTSVFSQLSVTSVKPNRISQERMDIEDAYCMNQPKGVAMIVSNDESRRSRSSSRQSIVGLKAGSPQPSTIASSASKVGSPKRPVPAVIQSLITLCAQLGFYNIQRHSLSNDELRFNMSAMSDQYHSFASSLNSLLVLISARSDEWGKILGGDGGTTSESVSEYIRHFTHSRCPALKGRPKIFIFLLRVTEHEPRLPVIGTQPGTKRKKKKKKRPTSSQPNSFSNHFNPEPLDVSEFADDMLVVRILHQNDGGDAAPTFGGITSPTVDKLPWHVQVLVATILEQAGYKDLLQILQYVREEIALGPKLTAPHAIKTNAPEDIVEIFVDHSLTKKLYLVPGI